MPSSIKDFPAHVQKQIKEKLKEEKQKTQKAKTIANRKEIPVETGKKDTPKYKNQKTIVNGIVFDSKKEALRYEELLLMLKSGEISNLKLQVDFTLQEAFTTYTGERIRAIRYKADFVYTKNGETIVEDVKSKVTKTAAYQIKKKLLIEKYGVRVIEV